MSRRPHPRPPLGRAGAAGLEQRVLGRFRRLRLVDRGPVLIAFSGGPDSLALAAVLSRLRPRLGRDLVAVHVDHGLRPASSVDAVAARSLADTLNLPCRCVRLDDDALGCHVGVGVEEAARRERYRVLARIAGELDASLVAVGHQRDDQAETILLHLLRGSGIGGAAGMAAFTERPVPWWPEVGATPSLLRIWRPLLPEPRAGLRAYVDRLDLRPLVDESNDDPRYRRNRIRAEAMPCLESIAPGAGAALARFGQLAADDDALLERLAGDRFAEVVVDGHLDIVAFSAEPVPLQRRILRRWLHIQDLPFERIEAVRQLALDGQGRRGIEIGSGQLVTLVGGRLTLSSRPTADD